MDLYTAQISRFREAKNRNIPYIDTTVKSGDSVFAPSWDIVMGHKGGTYNDAQYTYVYKQLMRESLKKNRARWMEVANMSEVAFMCYCEWGCFCHRLLLVDMFGALCSAERIPFNYVGELVPGRIVVPTLPGLL